MQVSPAFHSPSQRPRRFHLSHLGAALVLGHVALAGSAWAGSASSEVDSISPTRIEVLSNGVAYTRPSIALVQLNANLVVDIGTMGLPGRIKSWKAWIKAHPKAPGNSNAHVHFSQFAHSQSYPLLERPKQAGGRGIGIHIPASTFTPFLVEHCNWMANDLRNHGMSNQVIFSKDRVIPVTVSSSVEAEFDWLVGETAPQQVGGSSKTKTLEVVCKGQGGINPDIGPVAGDIKIKTEARLTSVTVGVLHDRHPQSCPTQANARVTFVSDTEGPFTWRFTSASGKVSSPIRMEMRPSDKQGNFYIRSYDQKFMVGENASPAGGGASGGGIGAGAVDGGFAGTTRPGSELPGAKPSGRGHHQMGGSYAAPTVPRLHQDALRVVVLNAAPGSVERSDAASYQVQCPVVQNPAVGAVPGEKQGLPTPAGLPSRAAGVVVPGAVKTAPTPTTSLPQGVRQPLSPVAPLGQRVAPTVAPAAPVARPPVPTTGETNDNPARTPRFGGVRGQAGEEGRAGGR